MVWLFQFIFPFQSQCVYGPVYKLGSLWVHDYQTRTSVCRGWMAREELSEKGQERQVCIRAVAHFTVALSCPHGAETVA
jgi:hypothetical protein